MCFEGSYKFTLFESNRTTFRFPTQLLKNRYTTLHITFIVCCRYAILSYDPTLDQQTSQTSTMPPTNPAEQAKQSLDSSIKRFLLEQCSGGARKDVSKESSSVHHADP